MIDRVALVGLAMVCAASLAQAQAVERTARVGVLCTVRCDVPLVDEFRSTLRDRGWVEGRNVAFEMRAAGGRAELFPGLARELAAAQVDVLVVSGPTGAQAATQVASRTMPVVFVAVADPVALGLVESLARPGGNVTGMATLAPGGMVSKHFDLIRELLPKAQRVAVLWNPTNEMARIIFDKEGPSSAARIGVRLQMVEARDPDGIAPAIERAARDGADVLYVPGDPLFHTPAERVPEIANRMNLPSLFLLGQMVRAGGLASYGADQSGIFRGAALQVDRILRGAKPADIPVEQPNTYELVINMTTAEKLGVSVPQAVRLRAEVVR